MAWVWLARRRWPSAALVAVRTRWFEAGWLRTRVRRGRDPGAARGARRAPDRAPLGLPPRRTALAGQRRERARGARGSPARAPDLVCVTGDLVSHPRGEPRLRRDPRAARRPFVVLGNHDVAVTRDPFSRAAELDDLAEADAAARRGGRSLERPRRAACSSWASTPRRTRAARRRPWALVDPAAPLRILLCHFPGIVRRAAGRGSSTSRWPGICTRGRSACRSPGARPVTLAHPRADATSPGVYVDAGRPDARLARHRDDVRPVPALRAARRSPSSSCAVRAPASGLRLGERPRVDRGRGRPLRDLRRPARLVRRRRRPRGRRA